MPNWKEVLEEIQRQAAEQNANPIDTVRRKYLEMVEQKTGRNVIAYYSGWLQRNNSSDVAINDKDKNAFMVNVHNLDRSRGLDLILHTPGGDIAATESLVDYLHQMFGNNIRAIIPQLSMSAGTMIAFSCRSIMMGKQSNLGPIDPQMGGLPCQSILEEFDEAMKAVSSDPRIAPLWQTIVGKYHPTLLGECKHAIDWSKNLATQWLQRNMLAGSPDAVGHVLEEFTDHTVNKSHARHISRNRCIDLGLIIEEMEADNELQDLILTVHHAFMHTLANTTVTKIVENHLGIAYVEAARV